METLRCINDCVYGIIDIPECARAAIGTALVQRLRRIKQLGNLMAWPSATHTRFEHSIGTMHLAHVYAKQLGFSARQTDVFVLAALLHDVGHGPYSHTFEVAIRGTPSAELFKNHDAFRITLVVEDPELGEVLAPWADDVVAVWTDDPSFASENVAPMVGIMHALLEGVAGVDRLDYVARDLYHTRPQMTLDQSCCQTIMRETRIDRDAGVVRYTPTGKRIIEHFLGVRAYLYYEVYLHRRAVAADRMLHAALSNGAEAVIREYLRSPSTFAAFDDGVIDSLARHKAVSLACARTLQDLLCGRVPKLVPIDDGDDDHEAGAVVLVEKTTAPNDMAHIEGIDPPPDIRKRFVTAATPRPAVLLVCRTHPPEDIGTMLLLIEDALGADTDVKPESRSDLDAHLAVSAYDISTRTVLRYRTSDGYTGVLASDGVFQLTKAVGADTPAILRRAHRALEELNHTGVVKRSEPSIVDPVVLFMCNSAKRALVFVMESGAIQINHGGWRLFLTLAHAHLFDKNGVGKVYDIAGLPKLVSRDTLAIMRDAICALKE